MQMSFFFLSRCLWLIISATRTARVCYGFDPAEGEIVHPRDGRSGSCAAIWRQTRGSAQTLTFSCVRSHLSHLLSEAFRTGNAASVKGSGQSPSNWSRAEGRKARGPEQESFIKPR